MVNNELEKSIKKSLRIKSKELDGNINLVCSEKIEKITGHFYLLECTQNQIREDDFVNFLLDRIVSYVMEENELKLDAKNIRGIVKKAMSKFVDREDNSEIGELILFCLLESKLKATQLLNKMQLKTSPNMYYHGLDALHLSVQDGLTSLFYGESKMHGRFLTGLKESISQMNDFLNDKEKRRFEVDLVSSKIDSEKFKDCKEDILKILNPYEKKRDLVERIAIFIGYDSSLLSKISEQTDRDLMDKLLDEFSPEIERMIAKIIAEINDTDSLKKFDVDIFVIPFVDIKDIKTKFNELIKDDR